MKSYTCSATDSKREWQLRMERGPKRQCGAGGVRHTTENVWDGHTTRSVSCVQPPSLLKDSGWLYIGYAEWEMARTALSGVKLDRFCPPVPRLQSLFHREHHFPLAAFMSGSQTCQSTVFYSPNPNGTRRGQILRGQN